MAVEKKAWKSSSLVGFFSSASLGFSPRELSGIFRISVAMVAILGDVAVVVAPPELESDDGAPNRLAIRGANPGHHRSRPADELAHSHSLQQLAAKLWPLQNFLLPAFVWTKTLSESKTSDDFHRRQK
jgi:hypothetical protein